MNRNKCLDAFGNRLKSARKMAGLSMDELVNKAGGIVTKQAISKYERGIMKPSSQIVISLASALDVKPEYFFRPASIKLSNMQFRKRAKLPAKNVESLKQRTIDFLERYMELEELVGIKEKFVNPLLNYSINSLEDVEKAVLKLRNSWKLGLAPIVNLLELLEEHGIKVYEVKNIDDFDGLSAKVGDIQVIVINKSLSPDRIRFTAAHELAHILCRLPKKSHREKLCHTFAGAFLLPKEILEKELRKKREQITLWELGEIKKLYGISMQAIVKRAHMLGVVSEFYYRRFREMINQKGWNKREPVDYTRKEESIRFRQLLHYAVSEGIITLSRAAELANMSLSEFTMNIQAVG